jgi:hypothetical protein
VTLSLAVRTPETARLALSAVVMLSVATTD